MQKEILEKLKQDYADYKLEILTEKEICKLIKKGEPCLYKVFYKNNTDRPYVVDSYSIDFKTKFAVTSEDKKEKNQIKSIRIQAIPLVDLPEVFVYNYK